MQVYITVIETHYKTDSDVSRALAVPAVHRSSELKCHLQRNPDLVRYTKISAAAYYYTQCPYPNGVQSIHRV